MKTNLLLAAGITLSLSAFAQTNSPTNLTVEPMAHTPTFRVTVVSRSGAGVLAGVTSIQRLNTQGGKAPASGCDAAHVGRELRVRYSADYVFFAAQ